MTTWKKRVLGALVLAFGMATTIATSAVEYERSDTQQVTREAGEPTTIVVLVDPQTAEEGVGLRYDVTVTSEEDFGELRIIPSDPASEPQIATTRSYDAGFVADGYEWSLPIECFGGEWCSHVLTVEVDEDVPYELTVTGAVHKGSEFREDAVVIMDVE